MAILTVCAARADETEPHPWPDTDLPSNSDFHEGEALLAKHKWTEAATVLRALVNRDPRSMPAILGLARALTYSGRREEALALLSDAISREKGARRDTLVRKVRVVAQVFLTNATFQLYQDGVNLLNYRKYRAARDKLDHALAQERDNVEILVRLGQCLVLENDNANAAERLKYARKLDPFEPEIHLWLGRALHEQGELTDSIAELRSAKDELKTWELASIWLADALYASGQRQAAVQALEDDVSAHPLHVATLFSLAQFRLAALGASGRSTDPTTKRDQVLWSIRQDLQLALSRLPQYDPVHAAMHESSFSVDLGQTGDHLKMELQKLLQKVDAQIASAPDSTQT